MIDATTLAGAPPEAVEFATIDSIEAGCSRLGDLLGLQAPVSRDVFVSAVDDPVYANNLYLARVEPAFLARLLSEPPQRWDGESAGGAVDDGCGGASASAALVARATRSLVKWSRTGFRTVEDLDYRRRLQGCAQCPHHILPPGRVAYQIAGKLKPGKAGEQRICGLCGCFTKSKARLEHERCPDEHPTRPGFTRWGEPHR